MYISKLPPTREELWLKPKKKVGFEDDLWYEKTVVGQHMLDNFMKKISEIAGLSKSYTNHCIRSTVISNLDMFGFEARHITAVSGHKSENTIRSYSTKCPDNKKREMSDALSTVLGTNSPQVLPPKIAKTAITSTISKPPPTPEKADIFPTINNLDLVDWIPIENNAEDFDLGQIISEVDRNPIGIQEQNQIEISKTSPPSTLVQNFTSNSAQSNDIPFLPKMYFLYSNVMINYNFNK